MIQRILQITPLFVMDESNPRTQFGMTQASRSELHSYHLSMH